MVALGHDRREPAPRSMASVYASDDLGGTDGLRRRGLLLPAVGARSARCSARASCSSSARVWSSGVVSGWVMGAASFPEVGRSLYPVAANRELGSVPSGPGRAQDPDGREMCPGPVLRRPVAGIRPTPAGRRQRRRPGNAGSAVERVLHLVHRVVHLVLGLPELLLGLARHPIDLALVLEALVVGELAPPLWPGP